MFFNENDVYHYPLMWKRDYYTFKEFCTILGLHGDKASSFEEAIDSRFCNVTYTGAEDVYQFERMREKENVHGFIIPQGVEKKPRPCFLRVYNGGKIAFLVSKAGALSFIDRYQNELEALGMNKSMLKVLLYNIPIRQTAPAEVITLWDFTKKFTKNSKNVKALSDYIVDNLFDATVQKRTINGHVKSIPFFYYVKSKRRTANFCFNRALIEDFKTTFGPLLKKVESVIEAQNEFISLRQFTLLASGKHVFDKKLKNFIVENAMADMVEVSDETGNKVLKPIFKYENGALCMRKSAVNSFVQKYYEKLRELGFFNMNHILNKTGRKSSLPKDALILTKVAEQYGIIKYTSVLKEIFQSQKAHQTIIEDKETGQKRPMFIPYYNKNQLQYAILEKDMPYFFKRFYRDLLALGVDKDRLDDLSGVKIMPKRTSSMIILRYMFQKLGLQPGTYASLRKEIESRFLDDVYEKTLENGKKVTRPVFIKVKTQTSISYAIENKEAMQSFLKNRADFFLKRGCTLIRLNDLSGVAPISKVTKDLMSLATLGEFLSCSARFKDYIYKHHINDTYVAQDENGNNEVRKMFHPVRGETGHITYAIEKRAIDTLKERIAQYKINSDRQRKGRE